MGKYFSDLVDKSEDLDESEKKKLTFLCKQMILHGYSTGGHRFEVDVVRDS